MINKFTILLVCLVCATCSLEKLVQTQNYLRNFNLTTGEERLRDFPPRRRLKDYVIDLDVHPSLRFKKVNEDFKEIGKSLIQNITRDVIGNMLPYLKLLLKFRTEDPEIYEEIKSIATAWETDIDIIRILNLFNELNYLNPHHPIDEVYPEKKSMFPYIESGCTSIVGRDFETKKLIFARNLDTGPAYIASTLYNAVFIKNGTEIFRTTLNAGTTIFNQGFKNGQFAVSINSRHRTTTYQMLRTFWDIATSKQNNGELLRKALTNSRNYDELYTALTTNYSLGGIFFNIAGLNGGQGAIIARAFDKVDNIFHLGDQDFIVQTNYDSWINNTFQQNDTRRKTAIKDLTGKNITKEALYNAISDPLVIVPVTVLQCIMNPTLGEYDCLAQ